MHDVEIIIAPSIQTKANLPGIPTGGDGNDDTNDTIPGLRLQYTQLIARRIRENKFFSRLSP
jgi:hypothetical protein